MNFNTKKIVACTLSNPISPFELYKRNNQEQLPGGLFESSKQLQVIMHDFTVVMHGRANWRQILQINTAKGIKDILTNFILIDEQDFKGARLKHSLEELSLNNLPEKLVELGFNANKFCNYTAEMLKTLCNA
eukprot:3189467-Ditylum_brightwellii.AAC.1